MNIHRKSSIFLVMKCRKRLAAHRSWLVFTQGTNPYQPVATQEVLNSCLEKYWERAQLIKMFTFHGGKCTLW